MWKQSIVLHLILVAPFMCFCITIGNRITLKKNIISQQNESPILLHYAARDKILNYLMFPNSWPQVVLWAKQSSEEHVNFPVPKYAFGKKKKKKEV